VYGFLVFGVQVIGQIFFHNSEVTMSDCNRHFSQYTKFTECVVDYAERHAKVSDSLLSGETEIQFHRSDAVEIPTLAHLRISSNVTQNGPHRHLHRWSSTPTELLR
jgi:hypothetical protein